MLVLFLLGVLDVQHYEASLDLSGPRLQGQVTFTLAPTSSGPVVLAASGLNVSRVNAGGTPLKFRKEGETLVVEGVGAAPVSIVFDGPMLSNTQFHTGKWLPSNDDPGDKATLNLSLTVTAGVTTVAVGDLVKQEENGTRKTEHWQLTTPAPTFLYAWAMGAFRHVEEEFAGVRWHYYSLKHTEAQLKRIFAPMPQIYQVLASLAGTALPTKTYRQVLLPVDIAQEGAGIALISEAGEEWAITHELAHQWWGVGIQIQSWDHFWLNEGIASFATAVDKERRSGSADYAREMALALRRVTGEKPLNLTQGSSAYGKGALFLHVLRDKDPAAFFAGLARYTRDNLGKQVSTPAFEAAFAESKDLFKQWAYTGDASALSARMAFTLKPELVVTQIDKGVYRASDKDVNALAVQMGDGTVLLVDTLQSPDAMESFLAWLDARFSRPRYVAVNTHAHPDRVGGNDALLKRHISVWASDKTIALTAGKKADHSFPLGNQAFLFAGEKVHLLFPGAAHSPDNLVVYFPARGLLFGGCMVRPDGRLSPDGDLTSWASGIDYLTSLNPKLVIPGHGDGESPDALDITARALEEQL